MILPHGGGGEVDIILDLRINSIPFTSTAYQAKEDVIGNDLVS